jgi:hypothetical protein
MRQVLALSVAVVFALSLAGAAFAQSTQTTPGSSGGGAAPAPSPDPNKPTTDPSKSSTDPSKSAEQPKAGTAGKGTQAGQDKAGAGRTAAGTMRGQHRMMGEVKKVDAAKGTVTLKTDEGDLDLHFPPSALQGMKEGDRVEVQLAIRPAAGGAASKDMGKTGTAPQSGKGGKPTSSTDTGAKPGSPGSTSTQPQNQPKTQ